MFRIRLAVIFFFFLLTILFTYPLILHLDRVVFDIFNPLILGWRITWNTHQLFLNPLNLWQGNIFYPAQNSLAFSENLLGITILVLPIIKIFNNPILSHNIALFLSLILSGYVMFLLTYHLTKNYPTLILAGIIYAFTPFKIFRMFWHLNIASGQWLPFVFLYLHKFFENKKIKNIILFSLLFILQTLTSLHSLAFLLIGIFIFILTEMIFNFYLFLEKNFLKNYCLVG